MLRGLARVRHPAQRGVDRFAPYTQRWHAWVLIAPATYAYIAVFVASTASSTSRPPG